VKIIKNSNKDGPQLPQRACRQRVRIEVESSRNQVSIIPTHITISIILLNKFRKNDC